MDIGSAYLMDQVQPRDQVPPLVGTAHLQGDAVCVIQVEEIIALEDLVTEFSKRYAFLGVQPPGNSILGKHCPQPEIFTDIPEEINSRYIPGPVVIIKESNCIVAAVDKEGAYLRT